MNDQTNDTGTTDNPGDPWEGEMTSEFDRRVRDLHEAPLSLAQVKGRAVGIRRKRRAAVAGSILAAAAVIVPVAVLAGGGFGNDRASDPPVATGGPSATDPATPDRTSSAPVPADTGMPAYIEGTTFHPADGTRTTLPRAGYENAAVLGDLVAAYLFDEFDDNGDPIGSVDLVDGADVTATYEVRTAMVTSPDGTTVAFVTTDDELVVLDGENGEQSLRVVDPDVRVSAIVGDGDCRLESGCHPFLEHADPATGGDAFEINYEGPDTAPAPGALVVNDADDDFLVSVTTKLTFDEVCGGLYDRRDAAWSFQTCDYQVNEISPTGEFVTAFPASYDALGPSSFTILGADGRPVAEKTTDGVVGEVAWLDDTHVAATVFDDGAWKIISFGVDDGEEEVLVEGAAGPIERSPYHLAAR